MKAYRVELRISKQTFLIHGWSDKENGFVYGVFPNGERCGFHKADFKEFDEKEVDRVQFENWG